MANNCNFTMKIAGRPSAVREMADMLSWEGEFEYNGIGRVFSFDRDMGSTLFDKREKSTNISIEGKGECPTSIMSSMMNFSRWPKTLESESKRLGLCVEIYGSEIVNGFQEHYIIDKGNIIKNEHTKYTEIYVGGLDEMRRLQIAEGLGISLKELMENVNTSGQYTKGGFDNFGKFDNLFKYLKPEIDKHYSPDFNRDDLSVSLWARVGVSMQVSPEDYKKLAAGDMSVLKSVLRGETGFAHFNGETYFPDMPQNAGLENFGFVLMREPIVSREPVDVKVMVEGGIVQAVLKNNDTPVNVEVVDVDTDYEDYEKLLDYQKEIYADKTYQPCEYSVANFEKEFVPEAAYEAPEATVYLESAFGIRKPILSGSFKECEDFCNDNNWRFVDENNFEWALDIEDRRENVIEAKAPVKEEKSSIKPGLDSIIGKAQKKAEKNSAEKKAQKKKETEISK